MLCCRNSHPDFNANGVSNRGAQKGEAAQTRKKSRKGAANTDTDTDFAAHHHNHPSSEDDESKYEFYREPRSRVNRDNRKAIGEGSPNGERSTHTNHSLSLYNTDKYMYHALVDRDDDTPRLVPSMMKIGGKSEQQVDGRSIPHHYMGPSAHHMSSSQSGKKQKDTDHIEDGHISDANKPPRRRLMQPPAGYGSEILPSLEQDSYQVSPQHGQDKGFSLAHNRTGSSASPGNSNLKPPPPAQKPARFSKNASHSPASHSSVKGPSSRSDRPAQCQLISTGLNKYDKVRAILEASTTLVA